MSFAQYENMVTLFSETSWENTSMILEDLASVKDSYEIECIRTAVEITDKVYEEIIPMLRPGFTEKQVANEMVSKYRQYAEGEAYSPIVATGPNGALPHATPTDREFRKGDFIVIDAAAKYGGYHADMTRTPVVGEASDKHREIYAIASPCHNHCEKNVILVYNIFLDTWQIKSTQYPCDIGKWLIMY